MRCQNVDGGFGTRPGSESHAGQIYCCVGLLSIIGRYKYWCCYTVISLTITLIEDKFSYCCYSQTLSMLIQQVSYIEWMEISWAGGYVSGSCPRVALTAGQRSSPMYATHGGSWPLWPCWGDFTGSMLTRWGCSSWPHR